MTWYVASNRLLHSPGTSPAAVSWPPSRKSRVLVRGSQPSGPWNHFALSSGSANAAKTRAGGDGECPLDGERSMDDRFGHGSLLFGVGWFGCLLGQQRGEAIEIALDAGPSGRPATPRPNGVPPNRPAPCGPGRPSATGPVPRPRAPARAGRPRPGSWRTASRARSPTRGRHRAVRRRHGGSDQRGPGTPGRACAVSIAGVRTIVKSLLDY